MRLQAKPSTLVPKSEVFNPMVRRIVFSALCGAGSTALLSLTLDLPGVNFVASLFLLPGGLIQGLVSGTNSPITVLSADFLVHSVIVFVATSTFSEVRRRVESHPPSLWFALAVEVLVCMACIPTLDPLWPTGMTQLASREAQLHETLPIGIDLAQARGLLRSQGIEFWEVVEKYDSIISTRPEGRLSAASGDTVVSAKVWTEALEFPCGYRIDVILVFGKEGRLTDRYIHRLRICP
jgi:hypothetical protein